MHYSEMDYYDRGPRKGSGLIEEYRELFPFSAFVHPDRVTYRSLHGGGPLLTTSVLRWLEEHVGKRDDGNWTWFGGHEKSEFAFTDEGDAAHFKLVWGGEHVIYD